LYGNIKTLARANLVGRSQTGENSGYNTFGWVDNLTYNYNGTGNRLKRVTDGALKEATESASADFATKLVGSAINPDGQNTHYAYDDNGNLTSDENKGITTIEYNHLNLPVHTFFGGNSPQTSDNWIENVYDASGIKLEKRVYALGESPKVTRYIGGFVYEGSDLQFMPTAEGRALSPQAVQASGFSDRTDFVYEYHYTCLPYR
jgi:YD repeat-containing protein